MRRASHGELVRLVREQGTGVVEQAKRLIEQGQHQEAIELLQRWLADNADDAGPWAVLGAAQFELENWAEAEKAAREVVRLRPDSAREWCNLGTVLRKVGNLEEATQAQEQALRLDWSYDHARTELSKLEDVRTASEPAGSSPPPSRAQVEHDPLLDLVHTDTSRGRRRVARRTSNLVWAAVGIGLLLALLLFVAGLAKRSDRQITAMRAEREAAEMAEKQRLHEAELAEWRRRKEAAEQQQAAYDTWLDERRRAAADSQQRYVLQTCPACGGSGWVLRTTGSWPFARTTSRRRCGRCRGSGYVLEKVLEYE